MVDIFASLVPAEWALDIAIRYMRAGLSILPIKGDGSKAPALPSWKQFQSHSPSEPELRKWFASGTTHGIGIIGGKVSGGLEILDFDDPSLFEPWKEKVLLSSKDELFKRFLIVRTPSEGFHIYYRCPAGVAGNLKLAMDESGRETLIETRGEGGYALAEGSPLECHPDRKPYKAIQGSYENIPEIAAEQRELLLATARSFDLHLREQDVISGEAEDTTSKSSNWSFRPGDDFNARATWVEILEPHGWVSDHQNGHWRRPGKSVGISANTNYKGLDLFRNFSSNALPFELRAYTKFAAYALLNHKGNFAAAAKELAKQGYGKPKQSNVHDDWPEPLPLPKRALPKVPELPEDLIPELLRNGLRDVAWRMQVSLEAVTIATIVTIGSLTGSKCRVRPKQLDDWSVVPNLWGILIDLPGKLKSSALAAACTNLLASLADQSSFDFEEKSKKHKALEAAYEAQKSALREQMKQSAKRVNEEE